MRRGSGFRMSLPRHQTRARTAIPTADELCWGSWSALLGREKPLAATMPQLDICPWSIRRSTSQESIADVESRKGTRKKLPGHAFRRQPECLRGRFCSAMTRAPSFTDKSGLDTYDSASSTTTSALMPMLNSFMAHLRTSCRWPPTPYRCLGLLA